MVQPGTPATHCFKRDLLRANRLDHSITPTSGLVVLVVLMGPLYGALAAIIGSVKFAVICESSRAFDPAYRLVIIEPGISLRNGPNTM